MKGALCHQYAKKVKQICRSCWSGENKIIATNMFAIPPIQYTFGVLKWNVDELQGMDGKTRKITDVYIRDHLSNGCICRDAWKEDD